MRNLIVRIRRFPVIPATLCLLLLTGLSAGAPAQDAALTILHVNDSHSHLLPYGPKDVHGEWSLGGLARVATVVGRVRATEQNVLLLHGGDFSVGDFMFQEYLGAPELQLLKAIGTDALVLGNHEFDLYPSTLEAVLAGAGFPDQGFPVLSANLDTSADPEISHFVRPYLIRQVGGVKVGILGLTTEFTNQGSNPAPIVVLPALSVAQAWVDSLRNNHHCDLVIVLSHLGVDQDQALAGTVAGIDLIVGGHSHTLLPRPISAGRTLIVQAGEFYGHIGQLQLKIHNGAVARWTYKMIPVDSSVPQDPAVRGLIDGLRANLEADPRFGPVYTQVVARAAVDLTKPMGAGICRDNPLGNRTADAFRELTGTDIAFQPQGFMDQSIWAGPIKGADVFQAVPYGFDQTSGLGLKLATFRTNGMAILSGLEFALYNLPYMEDFFLHVSGMSLVCNTSLDPGQRVVYSEVKINGRPVDPAASYTVTVPDGVVPFFSQIPGFTMSDLDITDHFVYQVVLDDLRSHTPVTARTEGRVLDLSRLSPPDDGAEALSATIGLFRANGWFRLPRIADQLSATLYQFRAHLREGKSRAAAANLAKFQTILAGALLAHHLTPTAAERLSYLAGALVEEIPPPEEPLVQASPKAQERAAAEQFSLTVPSPCRDRALIRYRLGQAGEVSLTVIDLMGRLVRTLVNEPEGGGARELLWDGRDDRGARLPSGKYFVALLAGRERQIRSLLLVR